MEYPVEFQLQPGDPGYSDTWSITLGSLGRVTFPPNAKYGGRKIRVFSSPEQQRLVMEEGNRMSSVTSKQPLTVPLDFVGEFEKSRILVIVNERLKELGLLGSDASPHAAKLARELGVDLSKVKGTGEGGKITIEDVRAAR